MPKPPSSRRNTSSRSKTKAKSKPRARSPVQKSKTRRDSTPEDDPAEDYATEDENGRRKSRSPESPPASKRLKRDGRLSYEELSAFKNVARRFSFTWSPYIDWSRVLNTGLDRDEVIEEGCLNVATADPERSTVLKMYDEMVALVPDAIELLEGVVCNEFLDDLVTKMNTAASASISNDIRDLKDLVLVWAKEALGISSFDPPLREDGKKSNRGWHHPQIARLLCTPIKLTEFCALVRAGKIRINHRHFPSCFYWDYGTKASEDRNNVLHHLLTSPILAKAWIHIFLGEANASLYNETDGRFRVFRKGKAYQRGITEVTPRTIAYTSVLVRHSLSASSDWRNDDGAVIKRSAFDAIVALFENPKLKKGEFCDLVLEYWNDEIGWMLPSADEATGLESDDDEDSSLNIIQAIVENERRERERQKATNSGSSSRSPTPDSSDTNAGQPPSSDDPASHDDSDHSASHSVAATTSGPSSSVV
ncbi:hypothetical protein K435DRAFT_863734 [Dendrothele bispora CBS 962.96]|uniref:Uncharacterized protein n=1 Tax=Dendrothele bispora (strain CBS 962.96) TaxID=1314807 RepID=A0A4S8LPL6_DENBC|nr:hypothetical protein K435DRAFT_863734 [Dendrothele bispora CBS 962.96]